ncbi:hypothetical protein OPT61_g2648 [Boeremia exigua]|uniref:Uncharacterized protein n=1 Tax=Boeremia exigua TaxID=749465 RepID=A0ACC2IL50_9PLEO|nr:hypothetical protein OPT61_g2648 [Boeremia exigua]
MASTSPNAQSLHHSTSVRTKEPHIPYRDTGAAGKSIFGQAPSWEFKLLPPLPFEEQQESTEKPSRFREELCDRLAEVSMDKAHQENAIRKEGKIQKAVKNFSRRFSTGSKV